MTGTPDPRAPGIAKRQRILIVEDEMMISMLLEDLLKSYGFEVVGPSSSVANAVGLASSEIIDAAILDLNVAGEEVYRVADALSARGIPFVFVTGYKASDIGKRYLGGQRRKRRSTLGLYIKSFNPCCLDGDRT